MVARKTHGCVGGRRDAYQETDTETTQQDIKKQVLQEWVGSGAPSPGGFDFSLKNSIYGSELVRRSSYRRVSVSSSSFRSSSILSKWSRLDRGVLQA